MATFEIEATDWKGFFDAFSRRHDGWRVTLEVVASGLGDQIEFSDMALVGISTESNGSRGLEIMVADGTGRRLTHTIDSPRHVWLKQDPSVEVLEIENDEGKSLVFFRP